MHTIIVGGGFAGVKAALEIRKKQLGKITLISDQPYFLHHATLYATATGRSTKESVVALDDLFAEYNDIEVIIDSMKTIDGDKHVLKGFHGSYHYDTLIIAIGMVTSYFNITGMAEHSFGIKSLAEVTAFNDHVKRTVSSDKRLDKNYVVIGGGPTGVELAGSLQSYLYELKDRYAAKGTVNVTLIEAAPRLLPRSSNTAASKVKKRLEKLGVKVLLDHKVESIDDDVIIVNGKKMPTHTAVWTSGVKNHPFFAKHPELFTLTKSGVGAVIVDEYMQAAKDIYVIGDNAYVAHSGLAWTAINGAKYIADHLTRVVTMRPLKKYRYAKPTESFPVGDGWAYTEAYGIYASGWLGYALRRRIELDGYRALLPKSQAYAAWRSHTVRQSD